MPFVFVFLVVININYEQDAQASGYFLQLGCNDILNYLNTQIQLCILAKQ